MERARVSKVDRGILAWMAGMTGRRPRVNQLRSSDVAQFIHVIYLAGMRSGWVYIMTNRPNGTLYTGVTSNIARRAYEHRNGLIAGFTKRYSLTRLVFMEPYEDIRQAIQRERNMKHWSRAWKVKLILDANPEWRDLYSDLA
jgi:putative endonuclease